MNKKPKFFKTQKKISAFIFSLSSHQRRTSFLLFTFFVLLFSSYIFAQEKNKKDFINDRPRHNKTNKTQSAAMPNSPQATGDTVSVKDDAGNVLMTVTDEGSAGSIKLNDAGAVSPNINKLYNNGGSLYWSGSQLSTGGSGGADSINQLGDAKYDGSSLFLGAGAGANDDAGASDGTKNYNTAVGKNALNSNTTGYSNTANGYKALFKNTFGISNTANGDYALSNNTSGTYNTANGDLALIYNTTGHYNVGIGANANSYNEEGSNNTIIGYEAGKGLGIHSKSGNIFLGYQAGYYETGSNKLYIENSNSSLPLIWGDFFADSIIINGNFHVTGNITSDGAGVDSINQLADGKYDGASLFLGEGAGANDNGGNGNTTVGKSTLYYNTTGYRNTANGYSSLYSNTTGHSNTANGYYALYSNTYGKWNTANGYYAFKSNTTGNNNVGLGCFADYNNETGSKNTIIGFEAGKGTSTHSKSGNVFLGYQAGYHETSDNKLYINNDSSSSPLVWGDFAADSIIINGNFHVTGNITSDGAGVGADSINQLADAKYDGSSLFLGEGAGANDDAGASDGSKNHNTAVGKNAFNKNTTGIYNTAIGNYALYSNETGAHNTANGYSALYSNTSGNENTANGNFALYHNTTGNKNVGLGNSTNYFNETGSKNTIIGYAAGLGTSVHNKNGNVFLGYKAGFYETGDNKLYIQNDSSSSPLIWGDFANDSVKINGEFRVTNNSIVDGKLGVGTQSPGDKVTIIAAASGEVGLRVKIGTGTKFKVEENGGVAIGANYGSTPINGLYVHGDIKNQGGVLHTSDRRFKKNIIRIPNALDKLNKINGVFYYWRTKEFADRNFSNDKQIGVIAQDVEKVFPELVNTDSEGYKSVNYSKLTPVLIEAIKTQDKRIKILENENKRLRNQFVKNTNLENKVMLLEQALNNIIKNKSQIKISSK